MRTTIQRKDREARRENPPLRPLRAVRSIVALVLFFVMTGAPSAQQPAVRQTPVLKPTVHPRFSEDPSRLWMAPTRRPSRGTTSEFAAAVKLEVDGNFAKALPIVSQPSLQQGTLGDYALYYQGFAEMRLGRAADARRSFQALQARTPVGYLIEGAALREAECNEALGDQSAALEIYERLAKTKTTAPDEVLMRLGRVARAAGNADKAVEAFMRVVYEFPFGDLAPVASSELETLPAPPLAPGTNRYKLELGRAERLFGSKRYVQARLAFDALRPLAQGDDRELVALRLAECDYMLKRARNARDGVRPYTEKAARQGEALYFYAIASRDLGDHAEYLRIVRRLVDEFSTQSWAEEALNNLATHYILHDDDDKADEVFRELYEKFPAGRYAERAAWKIGWRAYTNRRHADTIRAFESAAAQFPRSDYRPAWLYWSAKAHEALNERADAEARYTLVATDYLNTYYGRLAVTHLDGRVPQRRLVLEASGDPQAPADDGGAPSPALPPNEHVVRALLGLELFDQALDELHYAQKAWSDSPAIQATIGWIYHQRGDLRVGINAMKRAYPQYMASGGEKLPTELLKVLFPVNYWALIKRYSAERELDPYMMAALIAQESTFTEDIKSSANAYGLMQIVPATGRQYARMLKLPRRFSIGMLTTAETNLKMGTAYFADLVRQFGGAHYALATYNAGPSRVSKWIAQRPGLDRDEFIDNIPFPETQGYVKKILGTADDYRRLYGGESGTVAADTPVPAVARPAAKKPPPVKKKAPTAKKRTKKAA
jgi:soluble lytic murein transglycosylase